MFRCLRMYLNMSKFSGNCKALVLLSSPKKYKTYDKEEDKEKDHRYDDYRQKLLSLQPLCVGSWKKWVIRFDIRYNSTTCSIRIQMFNKALSTTYISKNGVYSQMERIVMYCEIWNTVNG